MFSNNKLLYKAQPKDNNYINNNNNLPESEHGADDKDLDEISNDEHGGGLYIPKDSWIKDDNYINKEWV